MAILILIIAMGMEALIETKELAKLTEQLYEHPFKVSNHLLEANGRIEETRILMGKVVLARSDQELDALVDQLLFLETSANAHFHGVIEAFLGDKADVLDAHQRFQDWKLLRIQIIRLVRAGRYEEARLLHQSEGKVHADRLTGEMRVLIDFARAKAERFMRDSKERQYESRILLISSLVGVILLVVIISVGTARRERESKKELLESESRFRELYEKTPVMLHSADEQGRIIYVNDHWLEHLGYSRDDVIGKPLSTFLNEESGRLVEEEAEPRFQETGKVKDLELEFVRSDGEIRIICLSAAAKYTAGGSFLRSQSVLEDITERRRAEEALRNSEARLKEAQRIAQIGSWELDLITNAVYWSDEVYRIFGIERREFGATYEAFVDCVHPDDREFVHNAYTESVKNRTTQNIVHRLLLKDGTLKFVNERGETFYDDTGKAVRSIGTVQDVTEHRRAEEQVRKLSNAVEQSPAAVVITDTEGVVEYVNPAFTKATGYEKKEMIGQHTGVLRSDEAPAETYEDIWKTVRAGNPWAGVVVHRKRDGTRFLNELTMSPIVDPQGVITNFVGIGQDITERLKAEQALEESQQRLSLAIDIMAVGILVIEEDGTITEFNPFAERIFGYEAAEAVGKNVRMLMPEPDRSGHDQYLRNYLDSETAKVIGMGREDRGLRKDGETFPMRLRIGELKTAEGSLFVYTIYDLSKIKQLEHQLRHSQKMDAIGHLTGGIAHDFNNILGIVMGNLELLQSQVAGNAKALKSVESALKGAERGASLTRKLLGFSRESADEVKLTNVNAFIETLHGLIAKSLTPSIEVERHLAADLWPVEIDPGDFEDVLLNLSLNARDAMPDGGALVIETAKTILDEDYVRRNPKARAGEFVVISLSDTGAGMTDEVMEKAFEPFFTTKEKGKGTGLGLSMAYGFVQRSGGHLKIYSEVGEGTTFRIYLPRAQEGTTGDEETIDIEDSALGGSETILIVDDEADLVDVAVTILEDLGYTTFSATDGERALKLLEDHEDIDLMFSDAIMPGRLDGYKLAEAAGKIRPALKVLLTSGFTKKREESVRGEDAAVTVLVGDMLSKPYNRSELARAIRRTLDKEEADEA